MVNRTSRSLSSVDYEPGPVPASAADLQRYINDELLKIAAAFKLLAMGHIDMTTEFPTKPRPGDFRYFDGDMANPGSGEGIYYYNSDGQWIQMG